MENTNKRFIGDVGEEIACRLFMKQGFKVLDRNYLKKWGEIDIVAKKSGVLHFVEVKTVSRKIQEGVSRITGYRPEENVHPQKLKRLHRAIESYLAEKQLNKPARLGREADWQIDVAVVYLDMVNNKAKVEILENVI